MLAIELSQDIETRLAEVAKVMGRSMEALALDAILDHLEDLEDVAAAEREIERVNAGEPTVPLAEVVAKHAVAD